MSLPRSRTDSDRPTTSLATRVATIIATTAALAIVAVPAVDVPWYATTALACALSIAVGVCAWSFSFVVSTHERLARLERANDERSNDR